MVECNEDISKWAFTVLCEITASMIQCAQGELRTRVKLLPITFWVLSPNTARICCFDDKMVEEHDVFWCPLPGINKIRYFFCLFPHLLACWKKKDAANWARGNADCQDWRNSSPTQETKYRLTTIAEDVVTPDSYRKSFIRYLLSNEPPPPL